MTLRMLPLIMAAVLAASSAGARPAPEAPQSVRLYVLDCGTLDIADISVYRVTRDEIATNLMSVPCFLVVHPKGTMMWETGAVPDRAFVPGGGPATLRSGTATRPLQSQLDEIGYAPGAIDYVAFSHFHWDHVGNANLFAGSTWLVRARERELMFAEPPSPRTEPANFSALKDAKTVIVPPGDYDVFGDGSVVIKPAPGHSPDHQVLFVNLKTTGPVVLSGDLYHYPEERTLNRVPVTEFDANQTVESRAALEAFLQRSGAQLWIEHDLTANAKLRKLPEFYE